MLHVPKGFQVNLIRVVDEMQNPFINTERSSESPWSLFSALVCLCDSSSVAAWSSEIAWETGEGRWYGLTSVWDLWAGVGGSEQRSKLTSLSHVTCAEGGCQRLQGSKVSFRRWKWRNVEYKLTFIGWRTKKRSVKSSKSRTCRGIKKHLMYFDIGSDLTSGSSHLKLG